MKHVPKIDGTAIEKVARAICIESGDKPDDFEAGSTPYDCFEEENGDYKEVAVIDRNDVKGSPFFYTWRLYVGHAIAAMEAMGVNTFGKSDPEYPPATPKPPKTQNYRTGF